MTTLELFKKHRKGEIGRDRFLYEVRRDSNLPWITNVTSYDDAVKILKNKGIIRESAVTPENTNTAPAVDRVNPYFLKRGVEKELENRTDLDNNSYEEALNKAANKLSKDPHAFDDLLIHNASDIHKKDEKLSTKPVKGGNHVDKDNAMTKMKGQETLKAMPASTKENRKGKPKDVKVMPDKGVEGSEKVIKEAAILELKNYLKKSLSLKENSPYHEHAVGRAVPTPYGEGIIKEVNGGTVCVEVGDKLYDVQMNVIERLKQEARDQSQSEYESGANQAQEHGRHQLEEGDPIMTLTDNLNAISSAMDTVPDYIWDNEKVSKEEARLLCQEIKDLIVGMNQDYGLAFENLLELQSFVMSAVSGGEYEKSYKQNFDSAIAQLGSIVDQPDDDQDDYFGPEEELEEAPVAVFTTKGKYLKSFKNPTDAENFRKGVSSEAGVQTISQNL